MKIRERKTDDQGNALECSCLIRELVSLHPHLNHNLWVAGMMCCIFDSFGEANISSEAFESYLTKYIDLYKELESTRD